MEKWIIQDWISNHLFRDRVFSSFEDGWAFLDETFSDEEDMSDYYVVKL